MFCPVSYTHLDVYKRQRYSSFTDTIDPAYEAPTNITFNSGCGVFHTINYTDPILTIDQIFIPPAETDCTVTYDVTVKAGTSVGTQINNTATIADPNAIYQSPATNSAAASTLTVGVPNIFKEPSGLKTVNTDNLPVMTWKMVWINNGNITALSTQVLDAVPPGTTYVANSVACVARGASATAVCVFDVAENRVRWEGDIAPDPGSTSEASAANEVVVTFSTTVPPTINSVCLLYTSRCV